MRLDSLRLTLGLCGALAFATFGCGSSSKSDAGGNADAGGNDAADAGSDGGDDAGDEADAPGLRPLQGFIGLWVPLINGTVFAGEGVADGTSIFDAFHFGEMGLMGSGGYENATFKDNAEGVCNTADVNGAMGIIRPPSEGGTVNVPTDTDLWAPAAMFGMIQGAARFSKLSKICPQIRGALIDDFWRNYKANKINDAVVSDIQAALQGKPVDDMGVVDHSAEATTPELKLYIVVYETETATPPPGVLNAIDGVMFWIYNQNKNFMNFDTYVAKMHNAYPDKDVSAGVYIYNGDYHNMTPASINYMIEHAISMYDAGTLSYLYVFSSHWIAKEFITQDRWDAVALPAEFDKVYYPYLGEGVGRVVDASGAPVEGALATVTQTVGGVSRTVTRKLTGADGRYRFGAWAGIGDTMSTDVDVSVSKDGFAPAMVTGPITRTGRTKLADAKLMAP